MAAKKKVPSTDILFHKGKRLFSAAQSTGMPWGRRNSYDKWVQVYGSDAGWPDVFCILRADGMTYPEAAAIIAHNIDPAAETVWDEASGQWKNQEAMLHRHTKAMKGTVAWGQIRNLDPDGYDTNRVINTTKTAFEALLEST